ncbi:MAG: carboxylating nicotinate-nucleotide diphosphorylase [Alphaproteobacteria bacterium]|nr:carboxylating nicotinate-nucleotide diphosphorylase [Alphaproteobacteria bacterium]
MIAPLPKQLVEEAVTRALREDLGDAGDITTIATTPVGAKAKAVIAARKPGVIAGVNAALAAFRLIDPSINLSIVNGDGAHVEKGDVVLTIDGAARSILSAERVALNFVCHLSGIATATAALVEAVKGTNAKVSCTRKTTPGLRAFEKHAVRCGGGTNHRFGLYDAVMIKDNHIAAAGNVAKALSDARNILGHMVKIEIEVDSLTQLDEVFAATPSADVILLDNFSLEDLVTAVNTNKGRATLEASGNVTIETINAIAKTGVDVISSGWITHSAPSLDLGLDFD